MLRLLALAVLTCGLHLGQAADEEEEEGWDMGGADDPAYWDRSYSLQGRHGRRVYEWYGFGYEDLQDTFKGILRGALSYENQNILVVGSGDSEVSSKLAAEGWQVASIDFSKKVVEHMRRLHPGVEYLHMDARNMSFPDRHFRFVLDKGLSDCIGTSSERRQYFGEVRRVLADEGGVLAVLSQRALAVPEDLGAGWQCEERQEKMGALFYESSPTLPPLPQAGTEGSIPYYLLVCRKGPVDEKALAEALSRLDDEDEAEAEEL